MPNASHTPRPPALLDPAPRRVGLRSQRPRQFVAHRGDIAAKAVGVCAHRDDHLIHLIQRDIAPSSRSGRRGRFRPPPPRAPAPPRYRRASRPRPHPAATPRPAPSPPPAPARQPLFPPPLQGTSRETCELARQSPRGGPSASPSSPPLPYLPHQHPHPPRHPTHPPPPHPLPP